jgi:hypothetical protein
MKPWRIRREILDRRLIRAQPAGQHNEKAQQGEIEQQQQIVLQAVDTGQRDRVIGHATEEKQRRKVGLPQHRLEALHRDHGLDFRRSGRLSNEERNWSHQSASGSIQ